MLGFEEPEAIDDALLHKQPAMRGLRKHTHKLLVLTLSLSLAVVMVLRASASAQPPLNLQSTTAKQWRGVSFGGWLVMEINPSSRYPNAPMDLRPRWMYDQIEANSELDFVTALRRDHGDEYAIATMKNHWTGYISDEMIDAALALGVDTVRLPVGYWIMDAPVGGSSPLEYGISPEGFVTGGLNHLRAMLVKLKSRGIGALVDLHAMPCNSACVSNGLYCNAPLAFAGAPIGDIPRCDGGVHKTTRTASGEVTTWTDVGVQSAGALAEWLAALPAEAATVVAMQLANEPALGVPGMYDEGVNAFYTQAHAAARAHLPETPLILSFMGPTPAAMSILHSLGHSLLADHHYYLNWQALSEPLGWPEIHRRACAAEAEGGVHDISKYTDAGLRLIVGEWSLAINLDATMDLSDPTTVKELRRLYHEQATTFSGMDAVAGHFFWTLRMGSGWDPRPTDSHPHGRQLQQSSAWRSLPGYPYPVWSLLEMAEAGVATPLTETDASVCAGM